MRRTCKWRVGLSAAAVCVWLGGCYSGFEQPGASGTDSASGGTDSASATESEGSAETGTAEPPANVDLIPEAMSRRLTNTELNNTLMDLLADAAEPAGQFINEPEYNPFDNDYTLQNPSTALIESLEVMAQDVGDRLLADPTRLQNLVPCTPSGAGDAACLRQFVEEFGRRAMRRPLAEEEVEAYLSLQGFATETNNYVENDFYTAVGLVIQAIIQDPEFLYRLERGNATTEDGVYKLTDFEIASRMSYLLWGSTPDDALLDDAEAGNLGDEEGRMAAVGRMLNNDRARSQVYRYHAMWLGYRGIPVSQTLIDAFDKETSALIDRVVFDEELPYSQLFTMNETFVDDALAAHYGLPAPAGGEGWVSYDGTGRAGILGHGSLLGAFSKFSDTSPTQRGIFVRERLTCIPVLPPPPEVDADNEPVDPADPDACKAERYAVHAEIASCAACHNQFDPIGLGLENYTIEGVYRETETDRPECTITAQGNLPNVGTFSGPGELANRLTESGLLEPCAIEHYLAFAYGRSLLEEEEEHVEAFAAVFEEENYSFAGVMQRFVADEVFGFRKEPS